MLQARAPPSWSDLHGVLTTVGRSQAVSWSWARCLKDFFLDTPDTPESSNQNTGGKTMFLFFSDGMAFPTFETTPVWVGDLAQQLAMKGPPKSHRVSHWNGHISMVNPNFHPSDAFSLAKIGLFKHGSKAPHFHSQISTIVGNQKTSS